MHIPSRLKFLQPDNQNSTYTEDKAMTRSGLLFAGAENALCGHETPDGSTPYAAPSYWAAFILLDSLD